MVSLRHNLSVQISRVMNGKDILVKPLRDGVAPRAKPNRFLRSHRRFTRARFQGCDVWSLDPLGGVIKDKAVIYYLHGGAYVLGMQSVYFTVLAKLSRLTGCKVIAPCYPLPPEDDVHSISRFARDHFAALQEEYGASNIILMGDSAGANLALVTMISNRDASGPQPSRAVLWCPFCDQSLSNPGVTVNAQEQLLNVDTLKAAGIRYAAGLDMRDPRVSPSYAALHDLPPIAIFTGDKDLLHVDIIDFHAKLKQAGNDVTLHVSGGMDHVWYA